MMRKSFRLERQREKERIEREMRQREKERIKREMRQREKEKTKREMRQREKERIERETISIGEVLYPGEGANTRRIKSNLTSGWV